MIFFSAINFLALCVVFSGSGRDILGKFFATASFHVWVERHGSIDACVGYKLDVRPWSIVAMIGL